MSKDKHQGDGSSLAHSDAGSQSAVKLDVSPPAGMVLLQKVKGPPEGVFVGFGRVVLGGVYTVPTDFAWRMMDSGDFAVCVTSHKAMIDAAREKAKAKADAGK